MSWQATAYVKTLNIAPSGEDITRSEKLVLFVLADSHNAERRLAWPSIPTMAAHCLMCERQVQYLLHELERKGVIEIIRPAKRGRGFFLSYRLVALDGNSETGQKGAIVAPFSFHKKDQEGCNKTDERVQEGCKSADAHKESGIEPRTYRTENSTPEGAMNRDARDRALQAWRAIKERLKQTLPKREWQLWVRPAYLCKLLSGCHLLIALPPSNAIMRAAKERGILLRNLLAESGYNASFTKYPDAYELERLQTECPEFYAEMFGVHKRK